MKFYNYLNEAKDRKNDLGIYIGRFQGFTIGHKAVLDSMAKNHNKNILFLVKGQKTSLDKNKNPFPFEVQKKMVEKCLPSNVELKILTGSVMPFLADFIKNEEHKNYVLYSGPDRLEEYNRFKKYFKNLNKNLIVLNTDTIVPRKEGVSGTKFREALRADNKEKFKTVAPKDIVSMFDELKRFV